MSETGTQPIFIATFLDQIKALEGWLDKALLEAGITGAPNRRAKSRLLELQDEIVDICGLIAKAQPETDLSKLTSYAEFDASHLFAATLAKRADAGIQDLGSGVQDDLAEIASARKKELGTRLGTGKPLDITSMAIWKEMSGCDCIEEIGSTVMRLAEAVRYLFQTEFLRVVWLAVPQPTAASVETK